MDEHSLTDTKSAKICIASIVRHFEDYTCRSEIENFTAVFEVMLNVIERTLIVSFVEHSLLEKSYDDAEYLNEKCIMIPLTEKHFNFKQWTHLAIGCLF